MSTLDLTVDFARYPYLTNELAGVPGTLRLVNEDFNVDEVPAHPPAGEGNFVLLHIEKAGWTTRALVSHLRDSLGLRDDELGWAGLKDRHAVTRQWLSVPRKVEEFLPDLAWPAGVQLLEVARHDDELREGNLAGNRFRILLRGAQGQSGPVREIFDALTAKGVPNYFGPQRFGHQGANPARGYALIRRGRGRSRAWRDKLEINSLQSLVFNDWVALRLARGLYDRVVEGDIAQKYLTGGKFQVGDVDAEQPRALAGEIGATGPLFGRKYHEAKGEARALEDEALAGRGLTRADFAGCGGSRRALRWPLTDAVVLEAPEGLWLSFFLPKGGYATAVLREVLKAEGAAAAGEEDEVTGDG